MNSGDLVTVHAYFLHREKGDNPSMLGIGTRMSLTDDPNELHPAFLLLMDGHKALVFCEGRIGWILTRIKDVLPDLDD